MWSWWQGGCGRGAPGGKVVVAPQWPTVPHTDPTGGHCTQVEKLYSTVNSGQCCVHSHSPSQLYPGPCRSDESKWLQTVQVDQDTGLGLLRLYWTVHCTGLYSVLDCTLYWTVHSTGLYTGLGLLRLYWTVHCTTVHWTEQTNTLLQWNFTLFQCAGLQLTVCTAQHCERFIVVNTLALMVSWPWWMGLFEKKVRIQLHYTELHCTALYWTALNWTAFCWTVPLYSL